MLVHVMQVSEMCCAGSRLRPYFVIASFGVAPETETETRTWYHWQQQTLVVLCTYGDFISFHLRSPLDHGIMRLQGGEPLH